MTFTLSIPRDYDERAKLLELASRTSLNYRVIEETEFDSPTIFNGLISILGEYEVFSFLSRHQK